jgi:integrase
VIRSSKFRKSRLVPLHDAVLGGLKRYLERRRPHAPFDDHVFISLRGKPLLIEHIGAAFRTAADRTSVRRRPGLPRPLTRYATPSRCEPWKPARLGASALPSTWWRCRLTLVAARSGRRNGICRLRGSS